MYNIVVPMAGAGSRFASAGYVDPKPLIQIANVEMIRIVINNLRPKQQHRFIFICQTSHINDYNLKEKLSLWAPNCIVVGLDGVTEGAACTVLAAMDMIDNDDALMIANSDQYVDVDIDDYLNVMSQSGLDGLIMTMKADDPKWSFVGLDEKGLVTNVVEKQVISDEATVGIYNFERGRSFVSAAKSMIQQNLRVNNEFYVAPVYNLLIKEGKKIGIHNVGKEGSGMYGLGTPVDLEKFINLSIRHKAVAGL